MLHLLESKPLLWRMLWMHFTMIILPLSCQSYKRIFLWVSPFVSCKIYGDKTQNSIYLPLTRVLGVSHSHASLHSFSRNSSKLALNCAYQLMVSVASAWDKYIYILAKTLYMLLSLQTSRRQFSFNLSSLMGSREVIDFQFV